MIAILAVDKNWAIGRGGEMIYNLKKDLKHFKETTTGYPVIMGRKTYQSIGRPLPNRENIILSRKKNLKIEACKVFNHIDDLIAYTKGKKVFVIGGNEIILALLAHIDEAIITKIDKQSPADIYLHNFDEDPNFKIVHQSETMTENDINFKYVRYERIKK